MAVKKFYIALEGWIHEIYQKSNLLAYVTKKTF